MKIGIGLNKLSYTPEAYAYADYLKNKGMEVQLEYKEMLDPSLDLHIYFLGMQPFWKIEKNKPKFEIHEYHSLSSPPYAHFKNLIKSIINEKPAGRIFLNEYVEKSFFFSKKIPSLHRDMGIDKSLFLTDTKNISYDLIYSGSLFNRPGLLQEILRLAKINFKILIVGTTDNKTKEIFNSYNNIEFTGRVERHELPNLYKLARAGLNFTPNSYPFNVQTSTKTIEYCAAKLGVVSNRYKWSEEFSKKRNANFLWLEDLKSITDLDNFNFKIPDVSDLEWFNLLDNINFEKFIRSILR